jgi:lysophospholipase L1-like esterase
MRVLLTLLAMLVLPPAAGAIPPPDPARFELEISNFFDLPDTVRPPPAGAIVFYGSSSIRMWHRRLGPDFAPFEVVGRGFGGSTMSDAAHFVDRVVVPLKPWAVVLYEGDNDIDNGRTPGEVVRDFSRLATRLRARLPNVRLYVLSIKPSPARWTKWPAMQETNARLKALCRRGGWMKFVDVATPLLGSDGLPRPDQFEGDGLHLGWRGYETWRNVIFDVIRKDDEWAARHVQRRPLHVYIPER